MPYEIQENAPGCDGYAVVKTDTGEVVPGGCHSSQADADAHLTALNIAEYGDEAQSKYEDEEEGRAESFSPNDGMKEEAKRGLEWRKEFGRGGTAVGIARARDIVNGKNLPLATVKRMKAFFDRHQVDAKAEGFRPGEDGYPSNGRIAHALWGGDAGYSWAKRIVASNAERSIETDYEVAPIQEFIYEKLEEIVEIAGKFDKGIGAQGAHYIEPENNAFAEEGLVCSNCIFFVGGRGCEIVAGDIDPNAICKYWQIPETILGLPTSEIEIEVEEPMDIEEEPMEEIDIEEESSEVQSRNLDQRTLYERSVPFEIRSIEENNDGLTLTGYAAVFNSDTLIDNQYEGRFIERIRKGAFARTINARKPVLQFEHGKHPLLGSMPLGTINKLREDDHGLFVEARLIDNWLIQPVRDAIASGAIDGMSFRFNVMRESWDDSGDTPVRTLEEVRLMELGPVVFPAYDSTSVGVRSADLAPLLDLPDGERAAIARQLILGTLSEPAEGTSDRPAENKPDATPIHSGLTAIERSAILRELERVF